MSVIVWVAAVTVAAAGAVAVAFLLPGDESVIFAVVALRRTGTE